MKTVQFKDYGQPFQIVEVPTYNLERGQVLVKMAVASINPRDVSVRDGLFRHIPPPVGPSSNIVGLEGAGIVVASADEQQIYPVGSAVFFRQAYHLPQGGTWQEYVVATPRDLLPIPAGKTMFEAAAFRIPYHTALLALEKAGFRQDGGADQIVFIPAVGSAVGNAAIQLVRACGVQEPVTTAGSTAKAERARAMGYSKVIDLSQEKLVDGVRRLTNGAGVDVGIDMLGGPFTGQILSILKPGKTLVVCGLSAGAQATILIPELVGRGRNISSLNVIFTPPAVQEPALERVSRFWQENRITPLIEKVFHFTQAEEAQRYLTENRPLGRVLLSFE
ncbi:MAG TPA: zinc-binding alcohol dehydrogenase family protein [Ktedonobacteraceae bacterium]|nr:zinc-binding alcohol dehydrogenase family protein [Ktedonobacteraceae bacterium]